MSTGVSNVLKQNATEVERTLLGVSAEVARNFVGKAEEITTAVDPLGRADAHPRRQVERLLAALSGKSQEFASEVSRVTEHAVKAIEAKGFTFTQTMMDNSEHIARLINEASENATNALSRYSDAGGAEATTPPPRSAARSWICKPWRGRPAKSPLPASITRSAACRP